ncbi:hypothetical protein TNCV_5055991 [Trichonephila clavipes]|nr:hypothetical protein TNCV_5055991 [Trichonephila clavipes]
MRETPPEVLVQVSPAPIFLSANSRVNFWYTDYVENPEMPLKHYRFSNIVVTDHFAEVATTNGVEVNVPTPHSYVIQFLQNKSIVNWESRWSNSNTGLRVKSFFAKPSLDINPYSRVSAEAEILDEFSDQSVIQTYALDAKSLIVNISPHTDGNIMKIACLLLKFLPLVISIPKPTIFSSVLEASTSSSTQTQLLPFTSSVAITTSSESHPPIPLFTTAPSTS